MIKNNDTNLSYSLVDDQLSNRGALLIFPDGNAEITFESPDNDTYYKGDKRFLSMKRKIVNKNSQSTIPLDDACKEPRGHAVSFIPNKNRVISEGKNKDGKKVALKYRGGFWFPLDKLINNLCMFGASFETEDKCTKSFME